MIWRAGEQRPESKVPQGNPGRYSHLQVGILLQRPLQGPDRGFLREPIVAQDLCRDGPDVEGFVFKRCNHHMHLAKLPQMQERCCPDGRVRMLGSLVEEGQHAWVASILPSQDPYGFTRHRLAQLGDVALERVFLLGGHLLGEQGTYLPIRIITLSARLIEDHLERLSDSLMHLGGLRAIHKGRAQGVQGVALGIASCRVLLGTQTSGAERLDDQLYDRRYLCDARCRWARLLEEPGDEIEVVHHGAPCSQGLSSYIRV